MALLGNFRNLPIKIKHLLIVGGLILLVFWAQGDFRFQINYSIFLICNYLVWFLLLPTIYQGIIYLSDDRSKNAAKIIGWVLLVISSQWLVSNVLLSITKFLLLGQDLLTDWIEIESYFLSSLMIRVFDLSLFSGLLYWLHQQRVLTQKMLQFAETQSLLHQSKLQSLKSQLNPHFLFNALHIVNSQIGQDNEKARRMTLQISHLLRKLLAVNELEEHTLEEELDFVEMYLNIEKERFSDRFTVNMDISKESKKCVIPTMILQPLIENAFKHGISKTEGEAILSIFIALEGETLQIRVINPIPTKATRQDRSGIGLKNLEARLQLYYQRSAQMEAAKDGNRFITKLTLPI